MGVEVGLMAMECYTEAGKKLNEWYQNHLDIYPAGGKPLVTCDFAGSYSVGPNYYACH